MDAEQRKQNLGEALAKIRHHTSSKLPNQKAPAQLLIAVEETLQGGKGESSQDGRSPTEYLLALKSMLKKATKEASTSSNSSTLLPSTMYLLTLVTPFVAPGVLRSQLTNLIDPLSIVLSNPYPTAASTQSAEGHAALLRSAMGVLQQLLLALAVDKPTLSSNLPLRGCWNSTLRLCMDARPKVRRRAQELVGKVLETEENAKAHPYAAKTAEWAISALEEVNVSSSISNTQVKAPTFDKKMGRATQPEIAAAERQKRVDGGSANTGIWVCGFLKQLAPVLPNKSISSLSTNLLRLISQRNPFLSTAAFEVFESLFKIGRPVNDSDFKTLSLSAASASQLNSKKVNTDSIAQTLDALCSHAVEPNYHDVQLIPAYLRALENAMVAYARVENGKPAWKRVPSIWNSITGMAFSTKSKASRDSPQTRAAGRDALSALVRYCIPDQAIEEALAAKIKGQKNALLDLIVFFEDSLDRQALRFLHSRSEILSTLATLISRLRHRPATETPSPTKRPAPAAKELLLHVVSIVGELRSQPNFEHREQADAVIGAAIEVCGPALVLEVLPLNLFGQGELTNGRAWLLPLMRTRITNTELSHFVNSMVPLSESLFNKRAEAEEVDDNGKQKAPVQAKVFEALTEQIWALLPGYCDLPTDMTEALKMEFVELLANVLYSQSSLRPSICRGFQVLVERNSSLANSAAPPEMLERNFGLDSTRGKANIIHLTSIAPNLLAVLFNIFSQSPGGSRSYLADCMIAYLGIMTREEVSKTYEKIVTMLEQALPTLVPARDREVGPGSVPPIPHTMLDLLILLVPFLDPNKEGSKLFELACDDKLLACRDAGLQKKAYRILARLMEGKRGTQILQVSEGKAGRLQELLEKLQSTTENVVAGAKRDRTALLGSLVPLIPQTELHFLPSIIPEAVLATKEVNQGARELAYNLLVEMGRKMEMGGQIKRHLVEGNGNADSDAEEKKKDEDEDEDMKEDVVEASLNEYVTMLAAGLAGSSPHMVSATITAMARLVYEFHLKLPLNTLKELVSTLEVFLASPNREIVKSTLGFVKVAMISLPANAIEDSLAVIVKGLLSDDNHHRQHFKAKIRHIFERLLRRFGYDRIEAMTTEENRKLLVNIRKRKERAKRKKGITLEAGGEDEIDEDETGGGLTAGQRAVKSYGADAFEEAIYGSESDLSASDDEEGDADDEKAGPRGRSKVRGAQQGSNRETRRRGGGGGGGTGDAEGQEYILQDDDAPMDLLDRSVAAGGRIMAGQSKGMMMGRNKKRGPGQEARRFDLDEATGRMLIDEPAGGDGQGDVVDDVDGAGRAYLDKERGTHGLTSKDGVMRINKNNKRNRAADDELEREQMALEDAQQQQQQMNSTPVTSLSSADKKQVKRGKTTIGAEFKAKKAGGDIKRGQTNPYAYVPLNQIGSKNKRSNVKILTKEKRRKV